MQNHRLREGSHRMAPLIVFSEAVSGSIEFRYTFILLSNYTDFLFFLCDFL